MYSKINSPSFSTLTCLGILLLSFTLTASAESGLLTRSFTSSFQLIEGGDKIIYIIDGGSSFQQDLFVREVRGSQEIKLSDTLGNQAIVSSFRVSSNESTVVYSGRESGGATTELYSVSISGGASVKLNVVIDSPNEALVSFRITPDGTHVVYQLRRAGIFSTFYAVPIGGGASTQLGLESEFIQMSQITNDSKFLIFIGDQLDATYTANVYRADLSDGSVTQISDDLTGDGFLDFPVITPDGQNVIYDSISTVAEEQGLFVTSINNGNSTRLTPVRSIGVEKLFGADGQLVYYIADLNMSGQKRLVSVPLAGGNVVEVASNLSSDKSVNTNFSLQINADSSHAIFFVDSSTINTDLYSVNLTTGIAVKLNPRGGVVVNSAQISDDGNYVLYTGDSETLGLFELFSIPIGGGPAVKLNRDYVSTDNTGSGIIYDISPDSKRVAYWMDVDGDFKNEIFEVSITGGTSERLSPDLPDSANPGFPEYSDDGSLVVFTISEFDGVFGGVYAFDFTPAAEPFCFAVLASNDRTAVICL